MELVTLFYLLYNIMLTSFFAIAIAAAFYVYRRSDTKVCLVIVVLFSFCLLDNTIIWLTEDSIFFANMNNEIMTNVFTYKTLILLATDICYLRINELVISGRQVQKHYIWVLIHTLFIGFIPLFVDGGALFIWLYYTPSQIFLLCVALYGLHQIKDVASDGVKKTMFLQRYRVLLKVVVVFCVLVVVEDSYVIFNVDFYSDLGTSVFNRNISEELMSLCLAGFFIQTFWRMTGTEVHALIPILPTVEDDLAEKVSDGEVAFHRFCEHYALTDRERELMWYTIANKTNQEISEILFISLGTVKTHLHNIYGKVGVTKRSMLLQLYREFE